MPQNLYSSFCTISENIFFQLAVTQNIQKEIDYKLFTSIYLKTFGSLTFLRVWVREDELSSALKRKRATK